MALLPIKDEKVPVESHGVKNGEISQIITAKNTSFLGPKVTKKVSVVLKSLQRHLQVVAALLFGKPGELHQAGVLPLVVVPHLQTHNR